MRSALSRANDVLDVNTSNKKRVADQRPVASPGNRFGTHQRTALAGRDFLDPLNVLGELGGLHVIRIAAKREIVPAGVGGIGAGVAQAPKTRKVRISDSERAQGRCERLAVEVGIVPRPRHGSHVEYSQNLVGREQIDKIAQRPIRVPDCADQRLVQIDVAPRVATWQEEAPRAPCKPLRRPVRYCRRPRGSQAGVFGKLFNRRSTPATIRSHRSPSNLKASCMLKSISRASDSRSSPLARK